MSTQAKNLLANGFFCVFLLLLALYLTPDRLNNRKAGSRSGTFFQGQKNRKQDSGQKQNNARSTGMPLPHDLLHNRNYRKKNGESFSKF
jgi:hypothetical protein